MLISNYLSQRRILKVVTHQLRSLIPIWILVGFLILLVPDLAASAEPAKVDTNLSPQEIELTLAGPTGKIVTSRGTFTVVRFGTLREPHSLHINRRRPDDIATLDFLGNSELDVRMTRRNGETEVFNRVYIVRATYSKRSGWWTENYGVNPGFPVVVKDPSTGRLREEYFENYVGIRRISFDPPSKWKGKPAVSLEDSPQNGTRASESAPKAAKPTAKFGIGEKVCKVMDAYMDEYQGYEVLGNAAYKKRQGSAVITSFVERVEGDRLQLRVGGIKFRPLDGGGASSTLNQFDYEGSQLMPGILFWDKVSAGWNSCS